MSATHTSLITRTEIEAVVATFYHRVRTDSVLGPVFCVHVTNWDAHEVKIASFWAGAILRDRGYGGNPMQKHLEAGNVQTEHFAIWLGLFDEVLAAMLPAAKALHWSDLAHRIGQSLKYGLSHAASKAAGEAPRFRNTGGATGLAEPRVGK